MLTIKKILFPTDFSRCSDQALSHALYLTHVYGAELHVIHILRPTEYDPNNPELKLPSQADLEAQIQKLASEHIANLSKQKGIKRTHIVEAKLPGFSVTPTVLKYAEDHDVDLLVAGTHGRRGLGHVLLGSVSEELIRFSRCPVLTIREEKDPRPSKDIRRILVPVDFSPHAVNALAHANHLAEMYGATIQLLHFVEDTRHPSFYYRGQSSLDEWMPEIKTASDEELDQIFKSSPGPLVDAEIHTLEGRATSEIVRFAREKRSDLIVIATHGLTGLEHLLLGSVAEKVVRMAPCPVFALKAFGKSLIQEGTKQIVEESH